MVFYADNLTTVKSHVESVLRKLNWTGKNYEQQLQTHMINRFTSIFLAGLIASASALAIQPKADANTPVFSIFELDSQKSYRRQNNRRDDWDNIRYNRDNNRRYRDNNRRDDWNNNRRYRDNNRRNDWNNNRRDDWNNNRRYRDNNRRYDWNNNRRYDRDRNWFRY
ncbi:hypothetical protein [Anabaena subtropica]|nr:hypothetical protein [Anabaena subtropica]